MTVGTGAFRFRPIGRLSTPFRTLRDCPRNGLQLDPAPECGATIFPEFVPGLQSLAGFSHLILLSWLGPGPDSPAGLAGDPALIFTPPFDSSPRGVFATRSPARPNPVGLNVVEFDGFAAPDVLRVRFLDCLDGTPLLDIKPYLRTIDAAPEASMGWLARDAAK